MSTSVRVPTVFLANAVSPTVFLNNAVSPPKRHFHFNSKCKPS